MWKKLTCVSIAFVLFISLLTGCHPANEVAFNIGGYDITSSEYMYWLIQANQEARSKIDREIELLREKETEKQEAVSAAEAELSDAENAEISKEGEESAETTTSVISVDEAQKKVDKAEKEYNAAVKLTQAYYTDDEVNYIDRIIEKKKYSDWVKDRAVELVKNYAVIQHFLDEFDLELSAEDSQELESYIEYYWTGTAMKQLCEANGVSLNTFKKVFTINYSRSLVFEYFYHEGGPKEVKNDEIVKTINEKFMTAQTLSVSLYNEQGQRLADAEIESIRTAFGEYKTKYDNKEMSFDDIYVDRNGSSLLNADTEDSAEDKEPSAKDPYAVVYGPDGTSSENANYQQLLEMNVGESRIFETNESLMFVIKTDIKADPYYQTAEVTVDDAIIFLKSDEFTKQLEEDAKALSYKKFDFAVNRFKVKKIDYSDYDEIVRQAQAAQNAQ